MCYRYSLTKKLIEKRNKQLRKAQQEVPFETTNGYDHESLPVIAMDKPNEVQYMTWGLIPAWAKDWDSAEVLRNETLNAKSETIFEKPSFKGSIFTKRCLVPADAFVDHRHLHGKKFPYNVMVKDDDFPDSTRDFCFGGIYATWVNQRTNEVHDTFSIITVPANGVMSKVHNSKMRMPLILHKADEQAWLTEGLDESHINVLMQPYPDKLMIAHTISRAISQPEAKYNWEVLNPVKYLGVDEWIIGGDNMDEGLDRLEQGSLF